MKYVKNFSSFINESIKGGKEESQENIEEAKIVLDTVLGEDPEWDEEFFEYLRSKGITYRQIGKVNGWPEVEYVGSKEALADMARTHFELADDEIEELMTEGRLLDIFEREEKRKSLQMLK
jgi:CRISPR/Cas system-associated endonuclease/helicase Cas3